MFFGNFCVVKVVKENKITKHESLITKCKVNEDWTMMSFKLDLVKFKMSNLDEDIVALIKKHVLDIAWLIGKTVKVELNDTVILLQSFEDYA